MSKTQEDFMNTEIDGMPFSEIMNQAVKLKTHQSKPDRWKWDSWPKIKQNTMFQRPEVEAARTLPFDERLAAAYDLKAIADAAFKGRNMYEAVYRYEHAVGVFRWLQNLDAGWKKKGINDLDISEHAYQPANDSEARRIDTLLVACYLNLARAYHKKGDDLATAMSACDYALAVDADCAKALLLRAQLRLSPASAGGSEQEDSLKDASSAAKSLAGTLRGVEAKIKALKGEGHRLVEAEEDGTFDLDQAGGNDDDDDDGQGQADEGGDGDSAENKSTKIAALEEEKKEVEKRAKEVFQYLKKLKGEQEKQKEVDKEWGGVFDRGVIYTKEGGGGGGGGGGQEGGEGGAGGGGETAGGDGDGDADPVPADVLRQLTDAQRLLQVYEQRNQHDDAARIRGEIETSIERIEKVRETHKARNLQQKTKGVGGGKHPLAAAATHQQQKQKRRQSPGYDDDREHADEVGCDGGEAEVGGLRGLVGGGGGSDDGGDERGGSRKNPNGAPPATKKKSSGVSPGFLKPVLLAPSPRAPSSSSTTTSFPTSLAAVPRSTSLTKAPSPSSSFWGKPTSDTRSGDINDGGDREPLVGSTFAHVDFGAPTDDMRKDAKERGIDLDDPAVLRMLQGLQTQHEAAGCEMTDESIAQAFDNANKEQAFKLRAEVRPLIESMGTHQLRDALGVLHVPTSHPATAGEAAAAATASGGSKADAFAAAAASTGVRSWPWSWSANKNKNSKGKRLSRPELVELMVEAVVSKAANGDTLPDFGDLATAPTGGGLAEALFHLRSLVAAAAAPLTRVAKLALRSKVYAQSGGGGGGGGGGEGVGGEKRKPGGALGKKKEKKKAMTAEEKQQLVEKEVKDHQARTFRITFLAAAAIFMARIWYSGHLQVLAAGLWGEIEPGGRGFGKAYDAALAARRKFSAGGEENEFDDEDDEFEEDGIASGFFGREF